MKTVQDFYNNFNFKDMVLGDTKSKPPILLQEFFNQDLIYLQTKLSNYETVLEIGCGFGRVLPELSKHAKRVVGIDFSILQLNQAKEITRNLNNVEVIYMNADNLEFKPKSFDISLCLNSTLGNMPGIEKQVIKEMIRVTKSPGIIVIRVFSDTNEVREAQYENYRRLGLVNIRDSNSAVITDDGFYSRRFSKTDLERLLDIRGIKFTINNDCKAGYLIEIKI